MLPNRTRGYHLLVPLLLPLSCTGDRVRAVSAPSESTDPARPDPDSTSHSLTSQPDPSIRIGIETSPAFRAEPELAASVNAVAAFVHTAPPSSKLILTFDPRRDVPSHANIDAYSAAMNAEFASLVPDRSILPIDPALVRTPGSSLDRSGVPWRAFSYANTAGSHATPSICDAGAVRFQTGGGFWTLSWNSDRGHLQGTLPMIREFLTTLHLDAAP